MKSSHWDGEDIKSDQYCGWQWPSHIIFWEELFQGQDCGSQQLNFDSAFEIVIHIGLDFGIQTYLLTHKTLS